MEVQLKRERLMIRAVYNRISPSVFSSHSQALHGVSWAFHMGSNVRACADHASRPTSGLIDQHVNTRGVEKPHQSLLPIVMAHEILLPAVVYFEDCQTSSGQASPYLFSRSSLTSMTFSGSTWNGFISRMRPGTKSSSVGTMPNLLNPILAATRLRLEQRHRL